MTTATVTSPHSALAGSPGRAPLAGLWTLVRFNLRRDRITLPAWILGIGVMVIYVCVAIVEVFPEDELASSVSLFNEPFGRLLIGPGYGFNEPTHEIFVANGYGLYFMLLAALMCIFMVVRHTRAEEQSGRAELIRANVVGRYAGLTAALVTTLIAAVSAGAVTTLVMIAVGGFATTGSLVLGAATAVTGLAFGAVAILVIQLTEYSRASNGLASAVLGLSFLVRAGGDAAEQGGSALSWVSPLGWAQQSAPFVLDRWWPLAIVLAFAVVVAGLGFVLSARRDVGSSLFAVRSGKGRAHPSLGHPVGLAWRLQRGSAIGWGVAAVLTAVMLGGFSEIMVSALDDLPEMFLELFSASDFLASYLAYSAEFTMILVSIFAAVTIQKLRSDETGGLTEPILATPVSRSGWLAANLLVTAVIVVVIGVLSGAASGTAAAVTTGDAHHIGDLAAAHVNMVPAVWLVLAIAAVLFAVVPRVIGATWAIVGYSFAIGSFGDILDVPEWAYNLSPFQHLAAMPSESFEVAPVLILAALTAVLVAVALAGIRRRDLDTV